MTEETLKKLQILTESAKYDVSCSSSGTVRSNRKGGVGNTVGGIGICHSFADDGRCISLLKTMLTNSCMYDCAYCINRRSNDIPRATFSVRELVELTMEFYRRNYIEGLFLSSGVLRNPDYAMEQMCRVLELLRVVGLEDVKDELATSLPYGKQRRLEIARALATDPQLLLLDEPAAGMNPQGKQKQSIENFRQEQESREDREEKREWQCCFFCQVSWVWYF